jgi:type II secretory pathway component GspD/PulD (secretin)
MPKQLTWVTFFRKKSDLSEQTFPTLEILQILIVLSANRCSPDNNAAKDMRVQHIYRLALLFVLAGCFYNSSFCAEEHLQVRIKAKIIEWKLDNALDHGISALYTRNLDSGAIIDTADLTFPTQTAIDRGVKLFFDSLNAGSGMIELVIEALEEEEKIRVLSEPNITLVEGHAKPAKVSTGTKVPYETTQAAGATVVQVTDFRDTGVTLTIEKVEIINNEYVQMQLNATVSGLTGYVAIAIDQDGNPISVPELSSRSLTNTILVKDKTPFIGGILKTTSKLKKEQGVPFLSSIPILGYLFKSHHATKSDTELIFLITPEILRTRMGTASFAADEATTAILHQTSTGS